MLTCTGKLCAPCPLSCPSTAMLRPTTLPAKALRNLEPFSGHVMPGPHCSSAFCCMGETRVGDQAKQQQSQLPLLQYPLRTHAGTVVYQHEEQTALILTWQGSQGQVPTWMSVIQRHQLAIMHHGPATIQLLTNAHDQRMWHSHTCSLSMQCLTAPQGACNSPTQKAVVEGDIAALPQISAVHDRAICHA
jgi:hypothetical protein